MAHIYSPLALCVLIFPLSAVAAECKGRDGQWHPYGSDACNAIATTDWVQRDLDIVARASKARRSCTDAIDVNGRGALQEDVCEDARDQSDAAKSALIRLEKAQGELSQAQLRLFVDSAAAHKDFMRALKETRPK